ncbi:hypothetical protein T03_1171 [Trichinella britovi]|uniref:Uncharacterized protein n=1 Tax=Trichinella britovi TaxID=45882 RepID=A0A0V1D7U7_TRIBR|nr:hypothetical protein T03_1171 [Trichinella britovi]
MTDSGSPVRQVSADIKIFWNTILMIALWAIFTLLIALLFSSLYHSSASLCLTGLLEASLCSGRIFAVVLFKVTLKIV